MKLLVIDDNEPVAEIVAMLSIQGGWEALWRTSAEGLEDLIRRENVDVLLIDYVLGPVTGLEEVEKLREAGLALPVILFTGNLHAVDMGLLRRLDVFKILEKPLSIPQMRQVLNEAKTHISTDS